MDLKTKKKGKRKMKKLSIAKLLSLVLVFTLLVGTFAVLPVYAAEATPSIEIVSNNVLYGENYHLMYAVETANAPAGAEIVVTISDGENTYETESRGALDGFENVFVSKKGVAAQDLATVFTATAKLMDGETVVATATQTYSVLEYVYTMLLVKANAENSTVTDDEKAMFNALLDYAAKAEKVLCADRETKINDYVYVRVVNGEEVFSGIYAAGTPIADIVDGIDAQSWSADNYDTEGNKMNSTTYQPDTDTVLTAGVNVILTASNEVVESVSYKLVTDVSQLKAGDVIVIAAAEDNYAIGVEQKSNNRAGASVTKSGDVITFADDVQLITLEDGTTGTFLFNVGTGYLAFNASANRLLTKDQANAANWIISIDANGVATIKGNANESTTNNRNWMRYNANNGSPIFACYGSGQLDICIYVQVKG